MGSAGVRVRCVHCLPLRSFDLEGSGALCETNSGALKLKWTYFRKGPKSSLTRFPKDLSLLLFKHFYYEIEFMPLYVCTIGFQPDRKL